MRYRQAAAPALAGGLFLTALLWWAGASAQALLLPGAADVIGGPAAGELGYWLFPWAYDPPAPLPSGSPAGSGGGTHYASLYRTGMQIRFAALFVLFTAGALLLVRRLPAVKGRTTAALLALWAWGLTAATLAAAVSAPWLIAAQGRGGYRFLPQLAGALSSGRQIVVPVALLAAGITVVVTRIAARGAAPLPQVVVPARAARLAATVGTAVVAVSVVVLSYHPVAAAIQEFSPDGGLFAEPGDLLRQWLLLGAWDGPAGGSSGRWLWARVLDALLLAVVWWALRLLPGLLTRATVPATAVATVCSVVLGLLLSQVLRVATDTTGLRYGLLHASAAIGNGVPAALTWGLAAGTAAAVTLRLAVRRAGSRAEPEQS
jgi:hypothetical protein